MFTLHMVQTYKAIQIPIEVCYIKVEGLLKVIRTSCVTAVSLMCTAFKVLQLSLSIDGIAVLDVCSVPNAKRVHMLHDAGQVHRSAKQCLKKCLKHTHF
jgi:hypothetical protein